MQDELDRELAAVPTNFRRTRARNYGNQANSSGDENTSGTLTDIPQGIIK
jgi:hypothetical protein